MLLGSGSYHFGIHSSITTALVGHIAAPFIFKGRAINLTLNFLICSTFIIGAISSILELKNLVMNFSGFAQFSKSVASTPRRMGFLSIR